MFKIKLVQHKSHNHSFHPTNRFEEVGHFELVGLFLEVELDVGVGVVDDGEEHVEQDEEDKEDVQDEEHRAEDAVRLLQPHEVGVAEDCAEQTEAEKQINETTLNIHGQFIWTIYKKNINK